MYSPQCAPQGCSALRACGATYIATDATSSAKMLTQPGDENTVMPVAENMLCTGCMGAPTTSRHTIRMAAYIM